MKDVGEYFTLIPNKFIWDCGGGNSYMKEFGEKTIAILEYLYSRTSKFDLTFFTLDNMITSLGYTPRTGKGNTNEDFKNYLINMQKSGIIQNCTKDIKSINANDFVQCELTIKQDKEFFTLYLRDFEKIFGLNEKNEVKMGILNLYCYILARLKKRDKDLCPGAEGYYAEATWFSQDQAIFDLNMPKKSFTKYLKILVENDLVCYGNIGLVSKLGVTKTANNVYTIEHEELKQALSESKYYYIQEGWTILNRNKKKVTKQIEGLKGRIKQLEKEGYDTFLLREKLHELEMGLEPENNIDK